MSTRAGSIAKRFAVLISTTVIGLFLAAMVPPAHATAPHNGWGFAVADDDVIGSTTMPPLSVDNQLFDRLRPKTFRFQIYWDAGEPSNTVFIQRAKALVTRLKAAGVEQVVATFKKHGATPTAIQYELAIRKVVDALEEEVDVWGPANEPNGGETWLPGVAGAQKLAEFNTSLAEVVAVADPTALRTSPDFVDRGDLGSISTYVNAYLGAGGGWGHYIAFHPYAGVHNKSIATVNDLVSLAPAGKPIWVTEAGAFGRSPGGVNDPPPVQNDKVNWMINTLANHARVERIYYYHMRDGLQSWDTGLLGNDLSARPAWVTWCGIAHNNSAHGECFVPATPVYDIQHAGFTGSGLTEVHMLNNSTQYTTWSAHTVTANALVTDSDVEWDMADANNDGVRDLFMILHGGLTGSGRTEVHVLNGATGYSTYLGNYATQHPLVPDQNVEWTVADANNDGYQDVFMIIHAGSTGSGMSEVHVFNGASNYTSYLSNRATAHGLVADQNVEWEVADANGDGVKDVFVILHAGTTGSGRTEVHVLNGAAGYTSYLGNYATAMSLQPAANAEWGVSDANADGSQDLFMVLHDGPTGSGRSEVHILSGATNYTTYLMAQGTVQGKRPDGNSAWAVP